MYNEAGKATHFSPHLNFYVGETENDSSIAELQVDWEVSTQQDVIDFLQDFAVQSGIDQQARYGSEMTVPSCEED